MEAYLDNAATTPMDEAVIDAMIPFMKQQYGNPSSIHSHGRMVRAAIEKSRKKVAELLNTSPSEIFFTSGGTEADNTAITCSVHTHNIKHVLSSEIEHHAVTHTLEKLAKDGLISVDNVPVNNEGDLDMAYIKQWIQDHPKGLVSLMHGNNEIGNINDIDKIGSWCFENDVTFHSDTVQTVGHFRHDLSKLNVHCMVGAAHKFHGPKGVGFLYLNHQHQIAPYVFGGAQERNMRGGTENVYGIVGLAKALSLAYEHMETHKYHILKLKKRMIDRLQEKIPGVSFNGRSADLDNSLYTVLNVSLPPAEEHEMLLFNLDINKISASGGSACSSGSNMGSHVLAALGHDPERAAVRFSFSKYNTTEQIDFAVDKLAELVTA